MQSVAKILAPPYVVFLTFSLLYILVRFSCLDFCVMSDIPLLKARHSASQLNEHQTKTVLHHVQSLVVRIAPSVARFKLLT